MKNNTTPHFPYISTNESQVSETYFYSMVNIKQRKIISLLHSRNFALLPVALLTLISLTTLNVHADEFDTLKFRVGENILHESNVFRLSDSANAQAIVGTTKRSDTVAITSAGLKLNKSYSLQRIELDVVAEDHRYNRFSNLNFTAFNYAAAFRWSVTPALHGNVTADRRDYVDATADIQNRGQLNRRSNRSNAVDAEYEVGSAWRIVGGVFERTSSSSQSLTSEGSYRLRGAEGGLRYVFPSGNSLAYRYKGGKGDYPDRPVSTLFANNFKDREHEFRLGWITTGKTTVNARLSQLNRKHDGLSTRDFSGVTGQIDAVYSITGKTSIAAGLISELGSYQTATDSYYQGNRLFISPTWKPTEKTAVRLRYDHGVRNFKGSPGLTGSGRKDTTNIASLALEWQPLRALKLIAFAQQENRKSNAPGFDYKNASVGISGVFSF